jgi:hypothetical protein
MSFVRLFGGVALNYARMVDAHHDYNTLKKYFKRRFSTKEAPIVACRQLTFLKQQEHKSLEDFSQRVYSLTLDAYENCEGGIIEEMAVETFLQGCKEKGAARHAMDKEPHAIDKALKLVSNSSCKRWGHFMEEGQVLTTTVKSRFRVMQTRQLHLNLG